MRQPHVCAGATPVVVWRSLAGRFIGRSDPDALWDAGSSQEQKRALVRQCGPEDGQRRRSGPSEREDGA